MINNSHNIHYIKALLNYSKINDKLYILIVTRCTLVCNCITIIITMYLLLVIITMYVLIIITDVLQLL